MLKAVIFDFDGVITDSEVLHFNTFNQVLRRFDITISMQDYYKKYLGLSDFDLFKLFIEQGKLNLAPDEIGNLITEKNEAFETLAKTDGKIIEGVRDFLKMLDDNNIPMAICSGALLSEIELILDQANLRDYFKEIVSAEQVQIGKPNPEGFELTLKRLNDNLCADIQPDECVVVEDSNWGIDAAKTADMHIVAITNSYNADKLAIAEKVVSHLNELTIDNLQDLCK